MPSLKDLDCSIEQCHTHEVLQEYGSTYGDGYVETFVALPSEPNGFAIRLRSTAYIAEGIAMYVFIDGVYQCNRNRGGLKDRKSKDQPFGRHSVVDFVVRQKEELKGNGDMTARGWSFEKLDIVSAEKAPKECSSSVLDNMGCIDVLVLRCKGRRTPKPQPTNMSLDGAWDPPDEAFDTDEQFREYRFDDCPLPAEAPGYPPNRPSGSAYYPSVPVHLAPSSERPAIYRVLWSATPSDKDHDTPRYNPSRGHRPKSTRISSGMFQYGSGPIPAKSKADIDMGLFRERTPDDMAANIIDPLVLKQITEEAYRKGLDEAQRRDETKCQHASFHIPGAFPSSCSNLRSPSPPAVSHDTHGRRGEVGGRTASVPSHKESAKRQCWINETRRPQQTEATRWEPANVNEQGSSTLSTWGTNDSAKQDNLQRQLEPRHRPSRDKHSTWWHRDSKVHAMPAAPTLGKRNDWGDETTLSWSTTSTSTNTSPPEALAGRQGHSSRENRNSGRGAARMAGDLLPPSSSITSSYATTYSGNEKKLYNSLPPAPTPSNPLRHPDGRRRSPPPPYGANSAILVPTPKSPTIYPDSRSTARLSSILDDSPLILDQKGGGRSAIGEQACSSGRSRPNHASQPAVAWDGGQRSGWGDNKGNPAMPGFWDTTDIPSGSGWGDNTREDLGVAWKASQKANEQDSVTEGWGTEQDRLGIRSKETAENDSTNAKGWRTVWVHTDDDKKNTACEAQDANSDPTNTWEGGAVWDTGKKDDKKSATTGKRDSKCTISGGEARYTGNNEGKISSTPSRGRQSRLRDYHRGSSTHKLAPQRHWVFPPPKSPEDTQSIAEDPPAEPLLPIPDIFGTRTKEEGLEYRVRAGKPTRYAHSIQRPEYIDSLSEPYAVFRFKYRTREYLQNMLGDDAVPETENGPASGIDETASVTLEKIRGLTREELIQEFLKMKGIAKEKGIEKENATTLARDWVGEQRERSRRNSSKTASKGSEEKGTQKTTLQGTSGTGLGKSKKEVSAKYGSNGDFGGGWGNEGQDGDRGDDGTGQGAEAWVKYDIGGGDEAQGSWANADEPTGVKW